MAHCHPEELDKEYTESEAEFTVFEQLKRQLDDSYHIFHAVTWTGNRNIRGECDFVIFKEDTGFITLEVKGGRIEVIRNSWYSVNRNNYRLQIKDPVKQARYAQYAFRDLYKDRYKKYYSGIFSWGVCFPDSAFPIHAHHKDLNKFNVLHAGNMDSIENWINNLFHYTRPTGQNRSLRKEETSNFLSLFNIEMHLPRSILFAMHKQQEEIDNINHFQEYTLDLFDDKKRIGFQGAAGTGKTWFAIKKATRLALEGSTVLFLCFSRSLKLYLRDQLNGFSEITIDTFHSFAVQVIADFIETIINQKKEVAPFYALVKRLYKAAGAGNDFDPEISIHHFIDWISLLTPGEYDLTAVLLQAKTDAQVSVEIIDVLVKLMPDPMEKIRETGKVNDFFSDKLPLSLESIFNEYTLRDQFDAIIIDEAQDFENNWCGCISYFFKNQQDRIIYIFYDDNQTIFRNEQKLPVVHLIGQEGLENYIFHLRHNLRNTAEIHDFAVTKTGLGKTSVPMPIHGPVPTEETFSREKEPGDHIASLLTQLVEQQGMAAEKIVILSNVPYIHSPLYRYSKTGGFSISTDLYETNPRNIRYRTISQHKGLESDIVILLLDYSAENAEPHHRITNELLYVGCTRARYLLFVVNYKPEAVTDTMETQ